MITFRLDDSEPSEPPPEVQEWMDRREAFDALHPRCGDCGQFVKRGTNCLRLRSNYWGEWIHD